MINPKELRIGNLVSHYGEVKRVDGTNYMGLIRLNQILDVGENAIHPIPLTPAWMAKCGFDWNPEEQVYFIQVGNTVYFEYDVDFNCSVVPETWRGQPLHLWGDNKFVHKLQNIYYYHAGEELKIKH